MAKHWSETGAPAPPHKAPRVEEGNQQGPLVYRTRALGRVCSLSGCLQGKVAGGRWQPQPPGSSGGDSG